MHNACTGIGQHPDHMNWRYITSCLGKVRYGRHVTAHNACVAMAKKGRGDMEAYECSFCGGFHIGHKVSGFIPSFRNIKITIRRG